MKLIYILSIAFLFHKNLLISQSLKNISFLTSDTFVQVALYADGNVRNLLTNNNSSGSANGAIGIIVTKSWIIWNASINIASNIDTLKAGFGSVVLSPSNGRLLTSGLLEFNIKDITKGYKVGIHSYATASSSYWTINDNNIESTQTATIAGLGCLLRKDIIVSKIGDNPISASYEVGPTFRGIFGNISNNKDFLEKALKSRSNVFWGLEGGLNISFNGINAGLHGFLLYDLKNKNKIDDITSFQMTGGISISSPIISGKVKI